jgi:hypothetical protein
VDHSPEPSVLSRVESDGTTLIHALQERDGELGLETMCIGGGQGMAMIVERLS